MQALKPSFRISRCAKWIDLQRVDVAASLAYVGSVVPTVTATLQTAILTTPVSESENLALRKMYFS